jgi:Fe-S cluster biogenesis protein NfuA
MTTVGAAHEIDVDSLTDRIGTLSSALSAHAGGLELRSIAKDGTVTVQFTGMCTGCPLRSVSFHGLVKPLLLKVAGVHEVCAEGGRISEEAEARIAHQLQLYGSDCLVRNMEGQRLKGT